MTLKKIDIHIVKEAISSSKSYSEVLRKLNIIKNGGNIQTLEKLILDNNISIQHFTRSKQLSFCLNCGKEIVKGRHYCSKKCQREHEYNQYIIRWKNGQESGTKGQNDTSNYIRKYLFSKYNGCQMCGWNQINKYTGLMPLQIHHIDGDCTNNREYNLQLLCPNCHSLTENFGSRNRNCTRVDKRVR